MTIVQGDSLPDATFRVVGPNGIETLSTKDVFGGKKVVLFAVPGAFTPTCHLKHLPGFVSQADAFKAKGVDDVVCVAVNDPFVLEAWGKATGAGGAVTILSDGNAEFTKKIGMDFDGGGIGLGTRSKRYAMVVEDGVVKTLQTEENPGVAEVSSAEAILAAL
ncbi:MAG: peroxiredoxin [Methyloceanibacter sp.]|uniref:peroxiredoxin n=1 Tax=Methyloceanibacter sp. TaxID=1965321 RepID=UPI001D5BA17B|nr:peroxiredoxin [Methyloceanibacter sp.]MCB1441564.1 peroxiredoxin [Methyloceanibacter sp.]MCC0058803.1 peroxiredoxin [Hyphomicrobiaceae bacterium]